MNAIAITIERVTSVEQCQCCYGLAREVWGDDAACSTAQMKVHATLGGVVLLARDGSEPIGFLFSFPALYRNEWVLWSHETAVQSAYLHRGVGHRLKLRQRELAAEIGFRTIAWTFDPLVSRNAYFNICKLGAEIVEYKVNFYGVNEGDLVNRGVETDRFVAVWPSEDAIRNLPELQSPLGEHKDSRDVKASTGAGLEDNDVKPLLAGELYLQCSHGNEPILTDELKLTCTVGDSPQLLTTQIPRNVDALLADFPHLVHRWRAAFRQVALVLLHNGYQVTGFDSSDGRSTYIWRRNGGPQ